MILHENRLPADDSHEVLCPYMLFFEKAAKFEIVVCCKFLVALTVFIFEVIWPGMVLSYTYLIYSIALCVLKDSSFWFDTIYGL